MEIRSQPANFSKSLRTDIWKNTETRQCRTLQTHRTRRSHSLQRHQLAALQLQEEADRPGMQEERQPEAGKLIWDLWVEERQQAADVVHTGHLEDTVTSSAADHEAPPPVMLLKFCFILAPVCLPSQSLVHW